jgi:hypothetical protein
MTMDTNLIPVLTAFIIGFVFVAAVGAVALLTVATSFFAENHAVRVRRHEGVFSYYGHLAVGH